LSYSSGVFTMISWLYIVQCVSLASGAFPVLIKILAWRWQKSAPLFFEIKLCISKCLFNLLGYSAEHLVAQNALWFLFSFRTYISKTKFAIWIVLFECFFFWSERHSYIVLKLKIYKLKDFKMKAEPEGEKAIFYKIHANLYQIYCSVTSKNLAVVRQLLVAS